MSKPGLAFGLNLAKKPGTSKPAPPKRKPVFGGDSDSDEDAPKGGAAVEEIGGDLDDFGTTTQQSDPRKAPPPKSKGGPPTQPPKLKAKTKPNAMFGDLSSAFESRKNAEAAAELDASVYEYDAVYESIKPKKQVVKEDEERKPKYMRGLMEAAEVRKRDALIAEEKKIAREREAEGEEYEGKEKFVTEAYKKQQEENKRIEDEEKLKEEAEAKKNKGGGMTAFYKKLLEKDDQRHAETLKAAEDIAKDESAPAADDAEGDAEKEKSEADVAKEYNDKGASVAVNEDGQIVDKRQLLKGGLNLGAKKKETTQRVPERPAERPNAGGMRVGGKQAMRERQTRMMEEQLEQSLKRAREEEDSQRAEVEKAAKSQKTEGEIMGAKERYLARKKAAEAAKKGAASGEAV